MFDERGPYIHPPTIWNWTQRYVRESKKRLDRLRLTGGFSRIDLACPQIRVRCLYLYRAVDDEAGRSISC
jgi:transposase-like protein